MSKTHAHSQVLVQEFHEKFGHPVAAHPMMIQGKLAELRVKLIAEELGEYAAALGVSLSLNVTPHQRDVTLAVVHTQVSYDPFAAHDIVEAADALADLDYVVQGANVVHGFPGAALVSEVHRSNMSKLGADGLPMYREDGKIMKGPGYFKPDIATVLQVHTNGLTDQYQKAAGTTYIKNGAKITELGGLQPAAEQQQGAFDPLK